jgi:hypothetical protein
MNLSASFSGWAMPLIPATLGALVSLQFVGRDLSFRHQVSSVFVSVVCAVYLAPVLVSWASIEGEQLHQSVEFLIGLFAIAIGREVFREIEGGLVTRIRKRFLGGDDK